MEVAETHLDHERAHELFGLFVDRELPEPDERALRGHLDACEECKSDFDRYAHTVSLVRSVERERAPDSLAALVMRRVRRRRRRLFGSQGGRFFDHVSVPAEAAVPIIAVAAAAALLFLLLR